MKIHFMTNSMILITHYKHQYFFIYIWSKFRIFDCSGCEVYMVFRTEVVHLWFEFFPTMESHYRVLMELKLAVQHLQAISNKLKKMHHRDKGQVMGVRGRLWIIHLVIPRPLYFPGCNVSGVVLSFYSFVLIFVSKPTPSVSK